MTIKETISCLKISFPAWANFIGPRQPKDIEDLEAQSPQTSAEKEAVLCRKQRIIFYGSLVVLLFFLVLFFGLVVGGIIPNIPQAAAQKMLDDANAVNGLAPK